VSMVQTCRRRQSQLQYRSAHYQLALVSLMRRVSHSGLRGIEASVLRGSWWLLGLWGRIFRQEMETSEIYLRRLSDKVTCKSRTENVSDATVAQDHVMNIKLEWNSRRFSLLGMRRPHLSGTG